jgi:hypothetical protein
LFLAFSLSPEKRDLYLLPAYPALALLGALAKGPIALILVAIPLVGWRWILGAHAQRATRAAIVGCALSALAPGLVWATAVVAREPQLAYDLFVGQFFERAVSGTNHINPFWYHFYLQPTLMLPWTLPMLAGSWAAAQALRARAKWQHFDAGLAQSGWWFWALFLAFSLSPEKRDLYLLPAYPALALLGARWLCEVVRDARAVRAIVTPVPVLLVLLGLALCASPLFVERFNAELPTLSWEPALAGLPLLLGAAIAVRSGWRGKHLGATLALAFGLAGFATATALLVFPLINPIKSARALALEVAAMPEHPTEIPCIGLMPEGYRYYSRRPIVHGPSLDASLDDPVSPQEIAFLALVQREGDQFLALVQQANYENWSAATRSHVEIRHEQLVGRRKIYVLGANRSRK